MDSIPIRPQAAANTATVTVQARNREPYASSCPVTQSDHSQTARGSKAPMKANSYPWRASRAAPPRHHVGAVRDDRSRQKHLSCLIVTSQGLLLEIAPVEPVSHDGP